MIEGFETIDPDIAQGHMTESGDPMATEDRCLRLEEQMKDMRTRMEKAERLLDGASKIFGVIFGILILIIVF